MAADKYRHAEDEYFKLRGQFDTGRLPQEQFDEKLRELMVQDDQGRYWMLGADSGKWYYYDGSKWVLGDPYPGASAPAAAAVVAGAALATPPASAPSPVTSPPHAAAAPPPPPPPGSRRFPLVPVLIALGLIVLAVVAFLLFQNRDRFLVAQQPQQITPVLPPTITRAPSPTIIAALPTSGLPPLPTSSQPSSPPTDLPTLAAIPTALPTPVPATSEPTTAPTTEPTAAPPTEPAATDTPQSRVTVIIVTAVPPTTEVLPTLLPTVTIAPPTLTATQPPPTTAPTKVPPSATPGLNFPPGVYVTKMETDPTFPLTKQEIHFIATFANTSGGTQSYNWLVQLYDPDKEGGNKRFGESNVAGISVPPGTSQFTVTYPGVTGPGGCRTLYAQAEFQNEDKNRTPFQNGNGVVLEIGFDVCPLS